MRTDGRRHRLMVTIAMMLVATGLLGVPPASSLPGTDRTPAFKLVNVNSGMVAVVYGGTNLENNRLVTFPANGAGYQHWVPIPFGPGFAFVNVNSNLVLDIEGGSTANGALIVQNSWRGNASQVWFLVPFGPYAVFVNGGSGLVMDVPGASLDWGIFLHQWEWNGGANQLWQGVEVGGSIPKPT